MKTFLVLFFFILGAFIFLAFGSRVEAASQSDLATMGIAVRDNLGNDIAGATVNVTLLNANDEAHGGFLHCLIPGGKKEGPYNNLTRWYDSGTDGWYYVLDNVCCTISGFDFTVSAPGYNSSSGSVNNPWVTGSGHSTLLVNDGGFYIVKVVTLTPVTYTCTTTSTRQCQTGSCVTGWHPDTSNLTCAPTTVCCVQDAPTSTPTPSATPTPSKAPTATPTRAPSITPGGATATPRPPTATPRPPTATPRPPTATPTLPPGTTATPVPPTATPTLTVTPSPTKTPTSTPSPSATATPTPPPFSENMCKCDGFGPLPQVFTAGDTLDIIAYAKVEGGDIVNAAVEKMLFSSGRGTDPNNITRDFPYVNPVDVSIESSTATKIRYKSTWQYKVPNPIDPNYTYKIWYAPQCVRKTSFAPATTNVLAANDTVIKPNWFDNLFAFIAKLFGVKPTPTQNNNIVPVQNTSSSVTPKPIILNTLGFVSPEIVSTGTCPYIKFKSTVVF